jgi:NodT family efflux transporter outer membrane factor (OMF) lipoprotein
MTMTRMWRTLAVSAGALLAGCSVGPDFQTPDAPTGAGYASEKLVRQTTSANGPGGQAQRFVAARDIPAQWWTLFRSPPLNKLIERSFAANPNIAAAQAALKGAVANVQAQEGAYYPQVAGGYSPSIQRTPTGSLSPNSASGNPVYTLHTLQVSVSYTFDVWGLNQRTVETLEAQADLQRYQLEAAYLTLASNVALAAVQEASLRAQIEATGEIIKIETELLELLRKQSKLGQIAEADVVAQETIVAQTEQTLPPLRKQLGQQHNLLAALAGGFPNEAPAEKFDLARLRLPGRLPVSLPSKLVQQRPDVRAAEANLHAAGAQVGVAIASRLPNLTLTGADGGSANRISGLFRPENAFWSLVGSAAQPLFDGGTLMYRQRAAEAGYEGAAALYRAAVIAAFQNVADCLKALEEDANALKAAVRAEQAAAESLKITRRQLELGAVSHVSLLNIQQAYQQTRLATVQAKANRYADTVALFQALGGGWWNRIETPQGKDLVADMAADLTGAKSKAGLESVARNAANR